VTATGERRAVGSRSDLAGRAFSDSFAGIEPVSVPMFVVAQLAGAAAAAVLIVVVYPHDTERAGNAAR
jgi:glycerol uptake facilitator-like aquaporin